jgi:hypothetical protein
MAALPKLKTLKVACKWRCRRLDIFRKKIEDLKQLDSLDFVERRYQAYQDI